MPILGNGITCLISNNANDNSAAFWNGDFASAHTGLFVDSAVFQFKDGASGAVEMPWPKKIAGRQPADFNVDGKAEDQPETVGDDSGATKQRAAANDTTGDVPVVRTAALAYGMREIVAVALLLGLDLIYVSDFIKKASAREMPQEDDSERAAAFGETASDTEITDDFELAYEGQSGSDADQPLPVSTIEVSSSLVQLVADAPAAAPATATAVSSSYLVPDSSDGGQPAPSGPQLVQGNSVISGTSGNDKLYGTDGDDIMFGGAGDDIMFGGAGNDVMSGGEGDDVVDGGDGNDNLSGDSGNDIVLAGAGNDTASGGEGNDFVSGGEGNDTLSGDAGNDIVLAGAGNDTASGGEGNDFVSGGEGNDNLSGDAGNDLVDGGSGADVMAGGTGDDVYVVDNVADIVAEEADEGTDTIVIETAAIESAAPAADLTSEEAVTSVEAPVCADDAAGSPDESGDNTEPLTSYDLDNARNVENLTVLGAADFAASGNELDNVITTGSGDDSLEGDAGNDTLIANAGNDTLDGGTGDDTLIGGMGDDTYVVDSAADVVVETADEGVDTIVTTVAETTLIENVENLTYVGTEDATLTGNNGDNTITGGDGDDYLIGDAGPATTVAEPAPSTTTTEEALAVLLGTTSDPIILIEPEPEPTLIFGSRSNDNLVGSTGGGRDILYAGRGNDKLDGGGGDDELSGGSGNDTFIFRAGFGNDVITDFDDDDDIIYLVGSGFDSFYDLSGHIEQVGDDVVIHVTAFDSITLQNFEKMNLSPYDSFIFA